MHLHRLLTGLVCVIMTRVIMTGVIMPSVIMPSVIVTGVIVTGVIMTGVIVPGVIMIGVIRLRMAGAGDDGAHIKPPCNRTGPSLPGGGADYGDRNDGTQPQS